MRLSIEEREEVVREFMERHGGLFDAEAFLEEVRTTGPTHRAYSSFQWDDAKAAHEHRLNQARQFLNGLTISFEVREIGRRGGVTIVPSSAPLLISPLAGRRTGGGYYAFDPDDEDHAAELSAQAASALRSWIARYGSTLHHINVQRSVFEQVARALETYAATRDDVA
jgi:hypothetical protein